MKVASTTVSYQPQACRASTTLLSVFPRRIVRYRELRGFSQLDLAVASGVSRSTLNVIEGGLAADVLLSTVERLAASLHVTPDGLLGYDDLDIVRAMVRSPVSQTAPPAAGRACPTCAWRIAPRELHTMGVCILRLSDAGVSDTQLGARFGLGLASIEAILREEHDARRRRRF